MRIFLLILYFFGTSALFGQSTAEFLDNISKKYAEIKEVEYEVEIIKKALSSDSNTIVNNIRIKLNPADTLLGFNYLVRNPEMVTLYLDGVSHNWIRSDEGKFHFADIDRHKIRKMADLYFHPTRALWDFEYLKALVTESDSSFTMEDPASIVLEIYSSGNGQSDFTTHYFVFDPQQNLKIIQENNRHDDIFQKITYKISNINPDPDGNLLNLEKWENEFNDYVLLENESSNPTLSAVMVGDKMPDFEVAGLDGNIKSIFENGSEIVIVEFWFMSCVPCINAIPYMNDIHRKFSNHRVSFFSVNPIDRNIPKLQKYLLSRGINFPVYLIAGSELAVYYMPAFPTIYVLNKDREIVFMETGFSIEGMKDLKLFLIKYLSEH